MVFPAPSSRIARLFLGTKYLQKCGRRLIKVYRARTDDGTTIYVRTGTEDDHIAKEIFHKRPYEKYFAPSEASVVIDIGANSGYFSLRASKLVGDRGRVVAIEPYSKSFSLLKMHLEINHIANVTPYRLALGSQGGTAHLNVYNKTGNNSLIDKVGFYGKKSGFWQTGSEEVTVDTLDSVISKLQLERVDILKIDTEGSELEVLKGASQVLGSFHPKVVAETHSYGASWRDIEIFLKSLGYSMKIEDYPKADKLLFAW